MFTVAAIVAVYFIARSADRALTGEKSRPHLYDDDQVRQSIVFARDDLKLIALILVAILIGVAVIADKLFWLSP